MLSSTQFKILIGDFNVNWLNLSERRPLYNLCIRDNHYRKITSCHTTDNDTGIDHIYTNLREAQVTGHILETYFSDHKAIYLLLNCF